MQVKGGSWLCLNVGLMVDLICVCFFLSGLYGVWAGRNHVWSLRSRFLLRAPFQWRGERNGRDTLKHFMKGYGIFGFIHSLARINKREKIEHEIFASVSFLRNIASIGVGSTLTTDSVIQTLAEQEGILRPVYSRMLSLVRLNRTEEAAATFSNQAETSISNDFARILIQWDKIKPEQLSKFFCHWKKESEK